VSFAAITLCVASQRVFFVVSIYFVIDSVRELLDTRWIYVALPSDVSVLRNDCAGRQNYLRLHKFFQSEAIESSRVPQ